YVAGQRLCPRPPLCIQFTELRDRLLHHLASASYRTHQTPVNMRLAVFDSGRVAQVHAYLFSAYPLAWATHLVGTTRAFSSLKPTMNEPRNSPPRRSWIK